MENALPRVPAEVEAAIKAAIANPNRIEATVQLASIANRATAALHQVARSEATARKGQSDWGKWAGLVNISRDAVLRTAASRQTATQLSQVDRSQAASEEGTPTTETEPPRDSSPSAG
jgi:hypothetical protein